MATQRRVECVLHLSPKARKAISKDFPGVAKALNERFSLPENASAVKEFEQATKVADALRGVVQSSEADCEYFPCVMSGVDLEDDAAFYGALGVGKKELATIGGDEQRKLSTFYGPTEGEENVPTVQLLMNLDDEEFDGLDAYLEPDEQKALETAARLLEKTGTVIGGVLCAEDNVSKLIFTVAKSRSGAWVGVCTCRIES